MWPCFPADGDKAVVVEEEEEVQDYRVKCLNNLAAAQLKLEQYEEALHTSRDVLCLDPSNVKALFRTGKVRDMRQKYNYLYEKSTVHRNTARFKSCFY